MTKKEMTEQELRAREDFYGWTPEWTSSFRQFRCYAQSSLPIMTERQCEARARKPDLFTDCTNRCPRWKHYRKMARKNGQEPRAYPPHRKIP